MTGSKSAKYTFRLRKPFCTRKQLTSASGRDDETSRPKLYPYDCLYVMSYRLFFRAVVFE
jgi:hypothetical protein